MNREEAKKVLNAIDFKDGDNIVIINKNVYDKMKNEKQQLISWLEDKIKEYTEFEKYLYEKENTKLVEKAKIYACIGAFREVLDFVKESDKDD